MSFILDALKKLEEKRQQTVVPDLLTVHASDPVKPAKRFIWLYLILSALFLSAVLLTVWLRPWNLEKQGVAKEPALIKQSNEDVGINSQVSTPVIKAEELTPPLQKTEADIKKSSHISGKTTAKTVSKSVLNTSRKEPSGNTVHKDKTSAVKESQDAGSKASPSTPPVQEKHKEATYNAKAASGERIPGLDELPLSIRQEIPDISISGHIYSDSPSARMVNINGSISREGDMMTSGIKLIEITDTGVILSYKNSRFYVRGF